MVDEAIPLHSVAFVIRVTGTVVGFALISGRFRFKGGIVLSFRRRPHLDPLAALACMGSRENRQGRLRPDSEICALTVRSGAGRPSREILTETVPKSSQK